MTRLTRRALLGGAAALVGLPLLEATWPQTARAGSRPPKRFISMMVPNGWQPAIFDPTGEGFDYTLSPCLTPLEAVRDRTLVLSGLDNRPGISPDRYDEHSGCTSAYLTASHLRGTPVAANAGWSVDQVLAAQLGGHTAFSSLQLGSEAPIRCYTPGVCPGFETISWRGLDTPLPKDIFPASVYARVFGGLAPGLDPASMSARARMEQRLLDRAHAQTASYASNLGVADRARLDHYLTGLSELERRLQIGAAGSCDARWDPPPADADPTTEMRAMADLITLSLQCDKTRFVTWMLGEGRSERSLRFLGYPVGHHDLSHEPSWTDAHIASTRWFVDQYVYLMQRLDSVIEPDGSTLLDNTLILWGSPLQVGSRHDPLNMTQLLGGGGGGAFTTGQRLVFDPGTPLANLYVSILQAFGVDQDTFGDDGTGSLLDLS